MADNNWIQEMVGRVVSQVLESQFPTLRDELVRRVLEELQPGLGLGDSSPKQLLHAISAVRQANGQKEILSALLDGASQFSSRAALFVVRGGTVTGWQGRGFADNDEVRNFSLDASSGLGARVLEQKAPVRGNAEDMDVNFTSSFSAPQDNRVLLLPLLLKEKLAAVLYADAGTESGGQLDDAALEMVALRRATGAEPAAAPVEKSEAPVMESLPAAAPVMAAVAEPVAETQAEAVAEPE